MPWACRRGSWTRRPSPPSARRCARRARPRRIWRAPRTSPRAPALSGRSATPSLRAASGRLLSADPRVRVALAGIVVLAAALRFSTLGVQSYWLDESYSVHIVNQSFFEVLTRVKSTEGAPPPYYYLGWVWRHAFGTSEGGLRSLSPLIGTATVPAAFYAGKELVSERAGLVTALLVALNPWLVWYSQEARTYCLLVLLSTVALAFFARALRT